MKKKVAKKKYPNIPRTVVAYGCADGLDDFDSTDPGPVDENHFSGESGDLVLVYELKHIYTLKQTVVEEVID